MAETKQYSPQLPDWTSLSERQSLAHHHCQSGRKHTHRLKKGLPLRWKRWEHSPVFEASATLNLQRLRSCKISNHVLFSHVAHEDCLCYIRKESEAERFLKIVQSCAETHKIHERLSLLSSHNPSKRAYWEHVLFS